VVEVDQNRMQQVVQEAFDKVGDDHRWQMAIVKAKQQIESNPYMHYDGHALLVLSPSGELYSANGTCQCKAYQHGNPCWHRAASRLVQRYTEDERNEIEEFICSCCAVSETEGAQSAECDDCELCTNCCPHIAH
jgi:hypothetical protein